jgi:hypothetical protein
VKALTTKDIKETLRFHEGSPDRTSIFLLLFSYHGLQTPAIEFEQVRGIVFRLRCCSTALESDSGSGGLAISSGHRYEFHEVERDIFIAARADRKAGHFHDLELLVKVKSAGFFRLCGDDSRSIGE